MCQDYIKRILKNLGVSAFCMLLLGVVSFFVFGEGKKNKTSTPISQQNVAPVIGIQTPNERFQEGKHYQKLSAKITTQPAVQKLVSESPHKIQVIEFFNYACFWCQRLHPRVNSWLANKPLNVVFYRFPVVFNKSWEVMAKAYFIVQTLNKHELDHEFFKAIHTDNVDLTNEKLLQAFFEKHGIEQQKFLEMYGSFAVSQAVSRSNELSNAYQLTASPAMIINGPTGSYLVTASMAGTEAAVMEVVNFLIERESKALKQQ